MNLVPKYNTIIVDKLGLKLFDRLCSPTGISLFFCRYLEEQESCHKGQSHRIGLKVFSASTSVTSPSSRATIGSSANIQVLLLMGLLSRNWSRRCNFCFFLLLLLQIMLLMHHLCQTSFMFVAAAFRCGRNFRGRL